MTDYPLFTVVIPTLNCVGHVGRALDSLERQVCQRFEVVVADGGSVDGTLKIIASYRDKLDVRVIEVGRGSIGMARNRGIEAARGELVCFLDADDFYLSHRLESARSILEADPELDGLFTAFLHYDHTTDRYTEGRVYANHPKLPREIFRHSTINLNTLTIRRHCLERNRIRFIEGARGRIGEDWDFAARLAETRCNIGFLDLHSAVIVKGHASHTTLERQWKMKVCALLTMLRASRRIPEDATEHVRAIQSWIYKTVLVAALSDRPMVAHKVLASVPPSSLRALLKGLINLSRVLPRNFKRRILRTMLTLNTIFVTMRATAHRIEPRLLQELETLRGRFSPGAGTMLEQRRGR